MQMEDQIKNVRNLIILAELYLYLMKQYPAEKLSRWKKNALEAWLLGSGHVERREKCLLRQLSDTV